MRKRARTVLCGGQSAMVVPTVTTEKSSDFNRWNYFSVALGFMFGQPKVETKAA